MADFTELDARKLVREFSADNKDVAELKFINDNPEDVTVTPFSGGLINHVFCVASLDRMSSVVIKHSEERLKRESADDPILPISRQQVEYDCLMLIDTLLPGAVPKPYCIDRIHNIIAMQDLSEWMLLGDEIQINGPSLSVAERIGAIWATVHRSTAKSNITPEQWEELGKFRQVEMKGIAFHFMFERPLEAETDSIMKVPEGSLEVYREYIQEVRETGADVAIKELYNSEQCLIQLDSHWKSAFVKDGHVAVFDFELAFLGHPAATVAYCIISYLMCFLMAKHNPQDGDHLVQGHRPIPEKELQLGFQKAVIRLLTTYLEERNDMSSIAWEVFLSETARFASAFTLVMAVFEQMKYIDPRMTGSVRTSVLPISLRLLRSYKAIRTVEELTTALLSE